MSAVIPINIHKNSMIGRRRSPTSSIYQLILISMFIIFAILRSRRSILELSVDNTTVVRRLKGEILRSNISIPDSSVDNPTTRRLSKHHQNHTKNNTIDYTVFSCDSLQDLSDKFAKKGRKFDQCEFAHKCNQEDGIIFPSLFCNYDTNTTDGTRKVNHHIPLLVFLSLCLLLLFRLLNSTTDEFFSPGLELFSLKLGLPPRFAGVTLLALGNGAPDVAATINAILGDEHRGYEMALGELTGVAMFVTSVILGVIVGLSGSGEVHDISKNTDRRESAISYAMESGVPCQGPLLRDISMLILVCGVSMSYLKRGIIDYGFVYTLMGMYVVYVLLVLAADSYHILYHAPLLKHFESLNDLKLKEEDVESPNEKTSLISQIPQSSKQFHRSGSDPQHRRGIRSTSRRGIRSTSRRGIRSTSHDHNYNTHHLYHNNSIPTHTHSIGEVVIEAMSNYSCTANQELPLKRSKSVDIGDRKDSDDTLSPKAAVTNRKDIFKERSTSSGWATPEEDDTEPLVIFHPHHAVHPQHGPGGLLFLSKSSDSPAVIRRKSFDMKDTTNNNSLDDKKLRHSSFQPNTTPLHSQQNTMEITNIPIMEDVDKDSEVEHSSETEFIPKVPDSWKEAIIENIHEFREHWRMFFIDIYHNEENTILDVVFLSVELPFTIFRKLTNPVPCDGYYCRPLVAVSLPLSSIWIWYYILDQFDTDIFQIYVGYVLLATTLLVGLAVLRHCPGGDGPLDLCVVVPLTLYGFVIASTYLDKIADTLVNLLELFGVLLRIPSTVLGLTVLAFGNSIQDLVANASLSKRGLSTMATTACFASPVFNLCVGLSIGFYILLKTTGKDEIHVELPINIANGFMFTIANCCLVMFSGVVIGRGMIGKGYCYVACILYVIYVFTSLYI